MSKAAPAPAFQYRRAVVPRIFPVEEQVPESRRHYALRTFLFELLRFTLGHEATAGSDQFLYWNAANPKRCLAPDVFLRLGIPDHDFDSWQTWVKGAPELGVEIISRSDQAELPWEKKLERYEETGVSELLRFDPDDAEGERLRVFDRIEGDLVERVVEGDVAPSRVLLGLTWVVAPAGGHEVALRLRRADGTLVPSQNEVLASENDALALEKDALASEKDALSSENDALARRIAELEEELRRRGLLHAACRCCGGERRPDGELRPRESASAPLRFS
jgi:Uma2 family endonuclease